MSGWPKPAKSEWRERIADRLRRAFILLIGWTLVTLFVARSGDCVRLPASLDDSSSSHAVPADVNDSSANNIPVETPTAADPIDLQSLSQKSGSRVSQAIHALVQALAFRDAEDPGSLSLFNQLLGAASGDPSYATRIISKVFEGDEPEEKSRLTHELTAVLQAKGGATLENQLASLKKTLPLVDDGSQKKSNPATSGATPKNDFTQSEPQGFDSLGLLALFLSSNGFASSSNNSHHSTPVQPQQSNLTPSFPFFHGRQRVSDSNNSSSSASSRSNHSEEDHPSNLAQTSSDSHSKQEGSKKDKKSDEFQLPPAQSVTTSSPPSPKESSPSTNSLTQNMAQSPSAANPMVAPSPGMSEAAGSVPPVLPNFAAMPISPFPMGPPPDFSADMASNGMDMNGYDPMMGGYGAMGGAYGGFDPSGASADLGFDPTIDPFSNVGKEPAEPYDYPIPECPMQVTAGLDDGGGDYGSGDEPDVGEVPSFEAKAPLAATTLSLPQGRRHRAFGLGIMAYVGQEVQDLCETADTKVALCQRATQVASRSSSPLVNHRAFQNLLQRFLQARKFLN